MRLEGRTVVITGGSGALGQGVVPLFIEAGAQVVLVDRTVGQQRGNGGPLLLKADVTSEDEVGKVLQEVKSRTGRIDALVNLVGGFAPGRLADTDTPTWKRMFEMNVTAAFVLSKAVIPHMVAQRSGRIAHIAARAGIDPFPGAAAYIASKAALIGMIRAMALEVGGSGITVNGILPTTIDTPANRAAMPETDPAKWLKPAAIGHLLVWLVSEEAGAVNGAVIPIG